MTHIRSTAHVLVLVLGIAQIAGAGPVVTRAMIGTTDATLPLMNGEMPFIFLFTDSPADHVWIGDGSNRLDFTGLSSTLWELVAAPVTLTDASRPGYIWFLPRASLNGVMGSAQYFKLDILEDRPAVDLENLAVLQNHALSQWDPAQARSAPTPYLRAFGSGWSDVPLPGGAPPRGCRIVTGDVGQPLRCVQVRLNRRAILSPFFYSITTRTNDDGVIVDPSSRAPLDMAGFFADGYVQWSIEVWADNGSFRMVNGLKFNALYHQKIDVDARMLAGRVFRTTDEHWAFNYLDRLLVARRQLERFLGDVSFAFERGPIQVDWESPLATVSLGLPLPDGSSEIIIRNAGFKVPGGTYSAGYLTSDEVLREELGHAIHFRGINRGGVNRNPDLLNYYLRFLAAGYLRSNDEFKRRFGQWNLGVDTLWMHGDYPPSGLSFFLPGAIHTATGATPSALGETQGASHSAQVLTTELVAYLEAFGFVCHFGGFDDSISGNVLEGLRRYLRGVEGIPAPPIPRIGAVDTDMPPEKVLRSEGHLAILLYRDFPRLMGMSMSDTFRMVVDSHALTFREFARYVKNQAQSSGDNRYWVALRRAAVRQNIQLKRLIQ